MKCEARRLGETNSPRSTKKLCFPSCQYINYKWKMHYSIQGRLWNKLIFQGNLKLPLEPSCTSILNFRKRTSQLSLASNFQIHRYSSSFPSTMKSEQWESFIFWGDIIVEEVLNIPLIQYDYLVVISIFFAIRVNSSTNKGKAPGNSTLINPVYFKQLPQFPPFNFHVPSVNLTT